MSASPNVVKQASAPSVWSLSAITSWLRTQLFSSPFNILLTLLSVWLLFATLPGMIDWFFLNSTISAKSAQECRNVTGACWAFVVEKHRLILFGVYPYEEQWRPLLATLLLLWLVALGGAAVLMWGGILGLTHVENSRWGGLPLTLMLSTFGIAFAFPLGIVLALGRRSEMPAIRTLCVVYIELIRGVPLISLLFMSAVMLPLFLPEGLTIDKLLRAQVAIILFAAAYMAETIRGGLQAIPKGQFEGADSLGLTYWQQMRLIVLPQALKIVIPPLVGLFIALFKDTSLVVIIGLFDLTQAAKASLVDQAWRGFSIEIYVFISAIYFIFCYSMSKYSQSLETRLSTEHQR